MVVVIGGLGCGDDVCNVVIKYYELKIPLINRNII
jgi:hypothetical protein